MTSTFSWQNSVIFLPCFILYSKTKFACYSRYRSSSYFCFQAPNDEKHIYFWCQFQKVLQVFIEPFNFSFFSISGWGIDLDYYDTEQFALERNRVNSVILRLHPSTLFQTLIYYEGCSISSKGFLPTVVDIMII